MVGIRWRPFFKLTYRIPTAIGVTWRAILTVLFLIDTGTEKILVYRDFWPLFCESLLDRPQCSAVNGKLLYCKNGIHHASIHPRLRPMEMRLLWGFQQSWRRLTAQKLLLSPNPYIGCFQLTKKHPIFIRGQWPIIRQRGRLIRCRSTLHYLIWIKTRPVEL